MNDSQNITIAGAGSIGCYLGGCLAAAGRPVTLLGRTPLMTEIARRGLAVRELAAPARPIAPGAIKAADDPALALGAADVILVTVKCLATAEMGSLIARYARPGAIVVSIQNGVGNTDVLRAALPGRDAVQGMVFFNVVQARSPDAPPLFHKATSGSIIISAGTPGLKSLLDVRGARTHEHTNMHAVSWGKLLVNLNNAVNALSGVPIQAELSDRRWRLLLARQITEGLAVLKAAGIKPARVEGVHARELAFAMRLPDALFRIVSKAMFTLNPKARSSMSADLDNGRKTEIDFLQGALLRLGEQHGVATPAIRTVTGLIKAAELEGAKFNGLTPSHAAKVIAALENEAQQD